MEDYSTMLEKCDTNRQRCSICQKNIPSYVQRLSIDYSTRYGVSSHRICARCLLELSKVVDKKAIKEWKKTLVVEAL